MSERICVCGHSIGMHPEMSEAVKLPVNGKCGYCGSDISGCAAGEYCSNKDCGYVDGYYFPRGPEKEPERTYTQAEMDLEIAKAVLVESEYWFSVHQCLDHSYVVGCLLCNHYQAAKRKVERLTSKLTPTPSRDVTGKEGGK